MVKEKYIIFVKVIGGFFPIFFIAQFLHWFLLKIIMFGEKSSKAILNVHYFVFIINNIAFKWQRYQYSFHVI